MVGNDINAKPASLSTVQHCSQHGEGMTTYENLFHLVKVSDLYFVKIHSCNLPVRHVVSLIPKDTLTI